MNKKRRQKWFQYPILCPIYPQEYNLFYDFTLFCYLNKIRIKEWLNYIEAYLDEHRHIQCNLRHNNKTYLRRYIEYVAKQEQIELEEEKNKLFIPPVEQERVLRKRIDTLCGDEE